jgi:hypothetical protein
LARAVVGGRGKIRSRSADCGLWYQIVRC